MPALCTDLSTWASNFLLFTGAYCAFLYALCWFVWMNTRFLSQGTMRGAIPSARSIPLNF
jgi:hypothetical protein